MQSKRRTKTAMKTTNPKWNQTFVYPCRPQKVNDSVLWLFVEFALTDNKLLLSYLQFDCDCDCFILQECIHYILQFSNRALEVTVWDYDKVGSSEFIGEVRSMFHNFFNFDL